MSRPRQRFRRLAGRGEEVGDVQVGHGELGLDAEVAGWASASLVATASAGSRRCPRLGDPPGPGVDPRDLAVDTDELRLVSDDGGVRLHQGLPGLPGPLEHREGLGIPCRPDQDSGGHRVDPGAIAGDGQEGRVGVPDHSEHFTRPVVGRERLVLTAGGLQRNRHVAESSEQLMGDPGIGRVRPEQPLAPGRAPGRRPPAPHPSGPTRPAARPGRRTSGRARVGSCSSEGLLRTRSSWIARARSSASSPSPTRELSKRNSP